MDSEIIVALVALIAMEVVLGIDNLVFIAILSNRLPEEQRVKARRIGLGLAVVLRFGMLAGASWLLSLTRPLFAVAGMEFSGKDLILLGGGLFLIGKAVIEIHHRVDPDSQEATHQADARVASFWATVFQILLLDMVFSVDSILAAVALTREFWIIATAIVVAVLAMLFSMDALSRFMERNPTVVMLALAFLVMIGMVLVAEGFGAHVPKGFVYVAMAFAAAVEGLNLLAKRAGRRKRAANPAPSRETG
ncbi:TerC family protein [Belnapia rosea]|uniref:Membrane protein TerC, possibly involved in tellurium resistance n=1 Tax=Belnapia rosea TaxID=938405 RepID=A0A1G7A585_9PROT|nr:TerC family protein [Belnapia rosea]SDB69592.1 Membrane protein TerC, possibly involved in tellurium resistance [Belnapia rosea]SDE09783.1 Membrane protein TerC, possibly involved in tellurium resistance [Belnapia rosea]